MRVLMISKDSKILESGSSVRERMVEYGNLVEELHIVVATVRKGWQKREKKQIQLSQNVWVYPTSSLSKWHFLFDAIAIGAMVVETLVLFHHDNSLITTQDPFDAGLVGLRLRQKYPWFKLHMQVHTDVLDPHFQHLTFTNRIRTLLARALLPRADCIRVVSMRIKRSLTKSGLKLKQEPIVLPIFVDPEHFRATHMEHNTALAIRGEYPQLHFLMLVAGRFTKEKHISLAIHALRAVVKHNAHAGLLLVGEGPLEEEYRSLANQLGIAGNVIIKPWVNDMRPYYAMANLFLVTSEYEGYGMALVEAAASGCPIVTTDVGVASTFFTDGKDAYICSVGDRSCFERRIITLIGDRDLRNRFSAEARRAVSLGRTRKEDYLERYRESWECCLRKEKT
jgi:1,2-diacylglycerol 3-alpha-glucosyltransferase